MALNEGRCPNCGSIILVDPEQEKSHCLYCEAVFDTQTSIDIAKSPEGVSFPNLPQEKYEGPSLAPKDLRADIDRTPPPAAVIHKKDSPAESFRPSAAPIPDMKLSSRQRILLLAGALIPILIFVLVAYPLTTKRDASREEILKAFEAKAKTGLKQDETIDLRLRDNSQMILIMDEIDEKKARSLYQDFRSARQEVLKDDSDQELSLYLASPEEGFIVSGSRDELSIRPWEEKPDLPQ